MASSSRPGSVPTLATLSVAAEPNLATLVDRVLGRFLAAEVAELAQLDPALHLLADAAAAAVMSGGKRVRPTFAYWGWRGAVGPNATVATVLPALAAVELLHAFALVHDDLMDGSPTRRGRPTTHRRLAADHATLGLRGGANRFGGSGAILVGDLCLVWADRLMARADVPGDGLAKARQSYDLMRVEAIGGQFLDLLGEHSPDWSLERALLTAQLKTASYTVTRPLQFGAALATAGQRTAESEALMDAYQRYGQAVGVAFQLRDDLLGLNADPSVTGKPAGEDLTSGKPTALLQLTRLLATPRERAELDRQLHHGHRAKVVRIIELIYASGAATRLEVMISERVAEARDALAAAPIDAHTRTALADLAEQVAWRTR